MGTPITRLARRLVVRAAVEMWTVCELQYRLSLKKVLCRGWTNHFGALQRKKCLFWTRRSCLNMWRSDSCSRDWSLLLQRSSRSASLLHREAWLARICSCIIARDQSTRLTRPQATSCGILRLHGTPRLAEALFASSTKWLSGKEC